MTDGNELDTLRKIITGKTSLKDQPYQYANIPLNGRLRTAIDGSELGAGDFQILKNMRYGEVTPKSVGGMTKITSSVIDATYLKPRAGHHFRKTKPAESHVLVQSWNAGMTASQVHDNTTAIPNVDDFTAANIWSDTAGAATGRFSDAPDGCVAYTNGIDSCIWGGAEYRVSGFFVGDPDGSPLYDYTERINNTLTDANNVATMIKLSGTVDAATTKLLLHMDGANNGTTFTDSSGNSHDFAPVADACTKTADKKYGTASCYLDGTGDYLTINHHADFALNGGIYSIDCWFKCTGTTGDHVIYYQETDDNNYYLIEYDATNDYISVNKNVASALTEVQTPANILSNVWYHLEVTETGGELYIFINGVLVKQGTSVAPVDHTGPILIGESTIAAGTEYFQGYIDEFRLSVGVARHITNFTPSQVAYGTATCDAYVASTRPLRGAKFYIGHANDTASSTTVKYWSNGAWVEVTTFSDGTVSGGITLAIDGSITFDTTVSVAKPRMVNNVYAYWYLFSFSGINDDTTVYYVTLDAPFQQIVDLWDGIMRPISSYMRYTSNKYKDETPNVLKEDYYHITDDPADNLTYSNMTLSTTEFVLCGFTERLCGMDFKIVTDRVNSVASQVTIYHWNGSAWTLCSGINDGTKEGGVTFSKSGTISWDAPPESAEFQTSVRSSSRMYWYYKIVVSKSLSASVFVDLVQGVPAQKTVHGYSYPVLWQNRLWLLTDNYGNRNSAICSATDTVCVFNGQDAISPDGPMQFGTEDELVAGATIFSRFSGVLSDNLILFKRTEVWLIDGTGPQDYKKYKISDKYGCVAPGTLKTCDMGYKTDEGPNRHVLIWQSQSGIVMFDGNSIFPISNDIEDKFDPVSPTCITYGTSYGFNSFYDSA